MRFEEFRTQVEDLELFGKGWRGYIYRARWKGTKIAIKVAKDREKEYAIRKECEILSMLKGREGFPQLLLCGENFIVYTFIEGVPLEKVSLSVQQKAQVYLKILKLIEVLDELRINKEEFGRLDKNTLLDEEGRVYLLDFERGSLNAKKLHNLTQFLQLLVREGFIPKEKAIQLGIKYSRGERIYDAVAEALRAFT